jgi:hypothetical protein
MTIVELPDKFYSKFGDIEWLPDSDATVNKDAGDDAEGHDDGQADRLGD